MPPNQREAKIPNTIDRAFAGCESLTSITVSEGNLNYSSQSGILYNYDRTEMIQVPAAKSIVTIPKGVTSIGEYAFHWCTSLTSITIPNSVKSIGHEAFCGCESLTSITIPDSVTSIGNSAFGHCTSLTSIILPNGINESNLDLPYGCKIILTEEVRRKAAEEKFIADSQIKNGVLEEYNGSSAEVTIPNSVTSIGNSAFACCQNLTSVTIGNGVTSIGERAFQYCKSLKI